MDALAHAERIAAVCERVLGETVRSVILHGSLALGDYVPGRSDIDLLAIVAHPLAEAHTAELTRALIAEQANTSHRVDLRVVTAAVAAAPTEAPPMELYAGLRPSDPPELVARHPGEPDLAIELSVCRERGRALRGAAPADLIGEVPDSAVLRTGDAQLARWQELTDDAPHAVLMVLTACRIWRFAETRSHCSKSEAGVWALARDPALQAVRSALAQRRGGSAPIAPDDIRRLLAVVRAKIAA